MATATASGIHAKMDDLEASLRCHEGIFRPLHDLGKEIADHVAAIARHQHDPLVVVQGSPEEHLYVGDSGRSEELIQS